MENKLDIDNKLDLECKLTEAVTDLKKARAIFSSLINDMNFDKGELDENDMHYIAFAFESLTHRAYAVIDYLHHSIDILDDIHV